MSFRIVSPLSPPAAWLGGKLLLSERIIAIIEAIPHRTYVEPFLGMGGIFFRRSKIPNLEVINDINQDIITLFRVLQHHPAEFVRSLRYCVNSRVLFRQLKSLAPDALTDIQRAARFYYLQRNCFSGRMKNATYGADKTRSRFNIRKLRTHLEKLHERLAGVVIEGLPYQALLEQYDTPETLFYCDPPYFDCEADYGPGVFSKDDFSVLAHSMRNAKAFCLLSINDVPEIREIFSGLFLLEVETTYTVGPQPKRVCELLISNRELPTPEPKLL